MDGEIIFNKKILDIDCEKEINRISSFIKNKTVELKKDGIIIGLSGGIDSAVAAALSAKALGEDKVLGLILPEKDSSSQSEILAKKEAERLGIKIKTKDITSNLTNFGTYKKRDDVIKSIFPEYDESYKVKITLPSNLLEKDAFNFFTIQIKDKNGNIKTSRLNNKQLNGMVSATNTKQRTRMMHLYYHAELKNFLVCGTTNKTEYLQGFFVKYGDGGVDIEPIVHMYKNQIFQIANTLKIYKDIINRKPSPDTYNFDVSDEEFYFRIPYDKLDMLLYAWEKKIPIDIICNVMDLNEEQVKRSFRDFSSKYKATKHLRTFPPSLLK